MPRTENEDICKRFKGQWLTVSFDHKFHGSMIERQILKFEQRFRGKKLASYHQTNPVDQVFAPVVLECRKNLCEFGMKIDDDTQCIDDLLKKIIAIRLKLVMLFPLMDYSDEMKSLDPEKYLANEAETELVKLLREDVCKQVNFVESTGVDFKKTRWDFCVAEIKLLKHLRIDGLRLLHNGQLNEFVHINKRTGKLTIISHSGCLSVAALKSIDEMFPELQHLELEFRYLPENPPLLKPQFFRNLKSLTIRTCEFTYGKTIVFLALHGWKLEVLEISGAKYFEQRAINIISRFRRLKKFTVDGVDKLQVIKSIHK